MKRVYFIRPIGMDGPVKIGCSRTPEGRRANIAPWSPFPLEVVAEIEGDFELERRFHAKFVSDHSHSEWFRWSAELQATIDAIRGGSFDTASLPDPVRLNVIGAEKRRWTPQQKERARLARAARRVMKQTDRVPASYADDVLALFVADPIKHGEPREEAVRRSALRVAESLRRTAANYVELAERHERDAA